MKRTLHWIGIGVSLLCLLYFLRAVAEHWATLSQKAWSGDLIFSIATAALLYLTTFALGTKAWQLLLRLFGEVVHYTALARILMLSQLGKYLPGNVGHHIGRVVLARQGGIPTESVVASMVVETISVLVAGGLCSLPAMALMLDIAAQHHWSMARSLFIAGALGLTVVAGSIAAPVVRRKVTAIASAMLPIARSSRLLGGALLMQCVTFLAGATGLFAICTAVSATAGVASPSVWFDVVGAYAVAWLLGFLMPGSPAGLGIREVALLIGLTPLFGVQSATTAAALFRLVTTTGDGIAFLLAAKVLPRPATTHSPIRQATLDP